MNGVSIFCLVLSTGFLNDANMKTRTKTGYIISIFLVFASLHVQSQQVTPSRYDLLFFGGGDLSYVKNSFINRKYARMDITVGSEFFIIKNLSVGVSVDYNLNVKYFEKGLYTSLNLSLYTNKLYFLKCEYIHHYKHDDSWKYPNSFKEHGYAVGIGKKIFLNRYILLDLSFSAQYYKSNWMDAQEENLRKETIQFTISTGMYIYIKTKTKNHENKN